MEIVYERRAGLDIGQREVVACIRTPDPAGGRRAEVRTFGTFSRELEALADWLAAAGVSAVLMEATGQYWNPIWAPRGARTRTAAGQRPARHPRTSIGDAERSRGCRRVRGAWR
jgi:hypothetical protein